MLQGYVGVLLEFMKAEGIVALADLLHANIPFIPQVFAFY